MHTLSTYDAAICQQWHKWYDTVISAWSGQHSHHHSQSRMLRFNWLWAQCRTPTLASTGGAYWLPVHYRIQLKLALLTHTSWSSYITNAMILIICQRLYSTNTTDNAVPERMTKFGKSAFCNHGSCPDVKIKFKDFSKTFKHHTKDIQGELY